LAALVLMLVTLEKKVVLEAVLLELAAFLVVSGGLIATLILSPYLICKFLIPFCIAKVLVIGSTLAV
jgi:hypothetical protein